MKIKEYTLTKKDDILSPDLTLKRLYLPYVLEWICPHCNKSHTLDLERNAPVEYPHDHKVIDYGVMCQRCEKESKLTMQLELIFHIRLKKVNPSEKSRDQVKD